MLTGSVLVIGSGAVGLSLAWELAQRDFQVTVLDRGQIGKATSWAASGILPPANFALATDPIDRLRGLSHQLFPQWAERLREETSIDTGFRRCGGWYLADTIGEHAALVGTTCYWQELGIDFHTVAPQELATREPALAAWAGQADHCHRSAWWAPDECQIRSPRYLQALATACRNRGVQLVPNATVTDIDNTATGAFAVVDGDRYQADAIVICGGAWSGQIAARLQLEQAIVPIRGQIVLLKTPQALFDGVINVGHRYLVARGDGHTLIGSCEQEAGFELATDEPTLDALQRFAIELVPELASAPRVSAWSGLRPMTFDGFPMLGRVPQTDHIYVAAGHYRSGLHLSPGTAVAMADLIEGRQPPISLDPFRVGKQQTHRMSV